MKTRLFVFSYLRTHTAHFLSRTILLTSIFCFEKPVFRRKKPKHPKSWAVITLVLFAANSTLSQTSWKKYENNPVLIPTETWESPAGVIGPRVLKTGNLYQMWYTGLGSRRQIGLAISEDGIRWTKSNANPVLSNGQAGDFDSEHVTYGKVILHNDQYWMWYSGHNGQVWQIGLATSPDGIQWTKHPDNPVLRAGSSGTWEAQGVIAPFVIYDGNIFKMWYNGNGTPYVQAGGYAESADGIHWQKHGDNPIFTPVPSEWESRTIGMSAVFLIAGEYQLFYGAVGDAKNGLGLATSQDGISWQRYFDNPILLPGENGAWDNPTLGGFAVVREDGAYKMWYSGYSGTWQIGYAESTPSAEECTGIPLPAAEAYGNIRGGDQSHVNEVAYCFPAQTGDKFLSFQVYDIDTPDEVAISINGTKIFDAPVTANNAWSGLVGVLLSDALIHDHQENELVFDNTRNPPKNWRWGVRQVSVDPFYALPSPAAYGRIPGGDQTHADKVVYFFTGQAGDMSLDFQVYDIDHVDEVDLILNGVKIHNAVKTDNESWSTTQTLLLPDDLVFDGGINILVFDHTRNPPKQLLWGVREISVQTTSNSSLKMNLAATASISGVNFHDGEYLLDGRVTPPSRPDDDDQASPDSSVYRLEAVTTISPDGHVIVALPALQRFDFLALHPEWHPQRYFRYRLEVSQDGQNWQTVIDKSRSFVHGAQLEPVSGTAARYLRLSGASVVIEAEALDGSEEAYWQAHDHLLQQAQSQALALAEFVLFRRESGLSVSDHHGVVPAQYDLAPIFPNPFNPETSIRISLPRSSRVVLAVYNVRGELVMKLAEGELSAGIHTFRFEGRGLVSGIYLCRLQADDFTATRKMVLAK